LKGTFLFCKLTSLKWKQVALNLKQKMETLKDWKRVRIVQIMPHSFEN
jgi:hypothetical protein